MNTISQYKEVNRIAVLMPAFCEELIIGKIVSQAKQYVPDIVVVDDASIDRTAICAEDAGAVVIRRALNGGKGASLMAGFKYVLSQNFDAVITMDADGFHDPNEIQKFLEAYKRTRIPVLIGNRMAEAHKIPVVRRWSIRVMSYWLNRILNVYVPDPPCGFRFYRCDVLPFILDETSSLPSEFETLLNIASRRIRVGSVRVTKQPKRHKSVVSPFRDVVRFSRVLIKYHRKLHRNRKKIRMTKEDL